MVKLAESDGFSRFQRSFSIPCGSSFRRLNPKAGETIPARVKEAENQTTGERTTFDAEVRRFDAVAPSQQSDGAI